MRVGLLTFPRFTISRPQWLKECALRNRVPRGGVYGGGPALNEPEDERHPQVTPITHAAVIVLHIDVVSRFAPLISRTSSEKAVTKSDFDRHVLTGGARYERTN